MTSALPSGQQSYEGGVHVQVVRLAPTRNNDVGTSEEAHEHAARHLEERISVRGGESQRDEVPPRRRPRPYPYVADAGRFVQPGDEQLAGERLAHRLTAG